MTVGDLGSEQVNEILGGMRQGLVFTVGGSRAHNEYGHDAQGWYREVFDEGAVQRQPLDEAAMRDAIADAPQAALGVLRALRWRELRDALACDALVDARTALERWRALGDPSPDGAVLHAWLHPEVALEAGIKTLIAQTFRSRTAWHLFMETVGWSRSPEVGRRGVAFVDALLAQLDEAPHEALELRDSFLKMQGEHASELPTHAAKPIPPEVLR